MLLFAHELTLLGGDLHRDSTGCMSTVFRLWYGFTLLSGNPNQLCIESAMALHCQRAEAARLRSSHVNHMITHNCS